ncbi:MAG TPA: nuclear transport factor 2 family protein [Gemmatimonadales bacterium]|nr:nuclear transport factor 2 family protein [Gemmatimonadales bacterium]
MTTAAPTATESIGRELVSLCKSGNNLDALAKFYSPEIVSIEAMDFDGMPARMTGIDAIRRKNEWWFDTFDVNSHDVEGPFVNGDSFAVRYSYDTTNKQSGERRQSSEIAVYTVQDGRIVQERFFSGPATER